MSQAIADEVINALGGFLSGTRLYELVFTGARQPPAGLLLVEAFAADEGLQMLGWRDVIALSTNAVIPLASLLNKAARLEISLADGSRTHFSGLVSSVENLGSFGGLARYRLRLTPWLWRLTQTRDSRVWQDKSVIAIIESVFKCHAPFACWRWSDETGPFMAAARERSYCCQYRESDFDFVTRLLTEEGLSWRFEEVDDGHRLVLFSDSTSVRATPEDPSSAAGGGVRFHAGRATETSDTIQSLQRHRSIGIALNTVLSYDYKSKRSVTASVPTNQPLGGPNAPALESYDTPGQYFFADRHQARRYAQFQMEAHEARRELWILRSTLRTARPGRRLKMTQGPLQASRHGDPTYMLLRVRSVGFNNLPTPAIQGMEELFGPIQQLLDESLPEQPDDFDFVIAQANASGYCNHIEAISAAIPWRPVIGENGLRAHPVATAHGSQTAIVVGADGSARPNGADEIHCDKLGRVRIRFHWQRENAGCWVRVGQRAAGGGMGNQFLPRIGQEVLVQFIENDIDRPVIVGALYNGQGEGGVPPTPGGNSTRNADTAVFAIAHDHRIAGQGNTAGGNSPLWHGGAAAVASHRNSAALSGIRSKEFGGNGYNQLRFDDTDNQGSIQLKSSHAASELNLGHLIHMADNYRGSLRGLGAELRTDDYGAIRAGAGLLVSSYKITHGAAAREGMADNSAGTTLLKQAVMLGENFNAAATTHKTVAFASHLGSTKAGASTLNDNAAPLKAMWIASAGMLSGDSFAAAQADAADKLVAPTDDKLPLSSSPIISVAARGGLGVAAGQNLQLSNGETITVMSGQDTQFSTGGQWRLHTGQAIGMLGGAGKPGADNLGLQLIAAQQAIDVQAQADTLTIQARDLVDIISANAHIDWAAAKSISLSTAGGANITIAGGNITVQCPGKIMVHAGKHSFSGPTRLGYPLPAMPTAICVECLKKSLAAAAAFTALE